MADEGNYDAIWDPEEDTDPPVYENCEQCQLFFKCLINITLPQPN